MTRRKRIVRQYSAEFRYGGRKAHRLHVGMSDAAVVRHCWRTVGRYNPGVDCRDARHALYLGALKSHHANQQFFRELRL